MSFLRGLQKTAVSRRWVEKMLNRNARFNPKNVQSGAWSRALEYRKGWQAANPETVELMERSGESFKSLPRTSRKKARRYVQDLRAILPKSKNGEKPSIADWLNIGRRPRGRPIK